MNLTLPSSPGIGRCQLTEEWGAMAKSHIIPNAFMRRADCRVPFMESDGMSRPIKRQTGWYDRTILGHRGEKHIAKFDDAAAKCFFGRGFTYRSRRNPSDATVLRGSFLPGQVVEIEGVDTSQIRLFALSLLWRAAVSRLPNMSKVTVRMQNLEDIRRRLLEGSPGKPLEYPVYFCVFDSAEELPKIEPFQPSRHPFYRFFLDGVVAYVCPRRKLLAAPKFGRLIVGKEADRFPMLCISSASSEHARLARTGANSLLETYGDVFRGHRL